MSAATDSWWVSVAHELSWLEAKLMVRCAYAQSSADWNKAAGTALALKIFSRSVGEPIPAALGDRMYWYARGKGMRT